VIIQDERGEMHPAGNSEHAARRELLFRETAPEHLRRVSLGAAYALKPGRLATLPGLAHMMAAEYFSTRGNLPDPGAPYENRLGLCGIARDLSVPALLDAYKRGLFPGGHVAPVKWFSPPERCVLFFRDTKIEKSVRRLLRKGKYKVTFDRDFDGVIKACAEGRRGKWNVTWITPRIMHAYAALHDAGYAHSYEVWNEAGELAGGGYGVAIGGVFFGESQFSRESNTSKLAQAVLSWHLVKWGFHFDDSKWASPTLTKMGFRTIPRDEFRARLKIALRASGKAGAWEVVTDPATVAEWLPQESCAAPPTIPAPAPNGAGKPRERGIMIPFLPALEQPLGVAEALLPIL
jgi:leucyl/phenylalanyl-tRNA--protein transferase